LGIERRGAPFNSEFDDFLDSLVRNGDILVERIDGSSVGNSGSEVRSLGSVGNIDISEASEDTLPAALLLGFVLDGHF